MRNYKAEASELCRKITIYDRIIGKNEAGFDDEATEEIVHSCWAKFARISGTEAVRDGTPLSTVRARFVIRATPKLTGWERRNLHVLYRSQVYEVLYVNEYADGHEMTELVTELRERSEVPPDEPDD